MHRLLNANTKKPTLDDLTNEMTRRLCRGKPMSKAEIKEAVRKL